MTFPMHPTPGFPGFEHVAGSEPVRCFDCRPDEPPRFSLELHERSAGMTLNPDPLHVPEPEPPRRSGCLSVLPWLALLYVAVMARFVRPPMCLDYGGWHPFEDETGFGSMDWFCQLPRGHSGDHWGSSS